MKGEGKVLQTAQLWVLPHLLLLPRWVDRAGPTVWRVGRVLARPPWRARGRVLLFALQPPVSRWMGRNLLLGL